MLPWVHGRDKKNLQSPAQTAIVEKLMFICEDFPFSVSVSGHKRHKQTPARCIQRDCQGARLGTREMGTQCSVIKPLEKMLNNEVELNEILATQNALSLQHVHEIAR